MRFMRFHASALTLSVILAVSLATPLLQKEACGQNVSGMTGVVTDQSGAAVPNAVITLKNTATGVKFTVNSNADGSYRFAQIPPGQGYEAIFTATGFAPLGVG